MKNLLILPLLVLILAGCQQKLSILRPPLEDEGEIYIYIQPIPQEADRLRFTLSGMSALGAGATETPLALSFNEIKGGELKSQRLLAYGRLKAGEYSGFTVGTGKAYLSGEEGESALLTPEKPVRLDFPFAVASGKAAVLFLSLNFKEAVPNVFSFTPAFRVLAPEKLVTNLQGFASCQGSNALTVFDKFAMKAAGAVSTGRAPLGIALDQFQRKAYITASADDEVDVLDVTSGTIINRMRLNTGDDPQEIGLSGDGRVLLTTNRGSNTVSFIDTASLVELERVKVGNYPRPLIMDRTGARAYVFNEISNSIDIVDVANRSVARSATLEASPLRGGLNRAGDRLYVVMADSPYLTVMDALSLSVVNRIYVGTGMLTLKVDAATDYIYISRKDENRVYVYDPFSFIAIDFIETPGDVTFMAIDGENNNLFMLVPDERLIRVAGLTGRRTISDIYVFFDPYIITMMGERR